jgi:malonyl-CoA/methylmalonyl-CoA synthetase
VPAAPDSTDRDELLFPWMTAPSERIALRVAERSLTQWQLAAACERHVAALEARGLSPGDRIGVWTHPTLETMVAFVAHAAAGYVSVPLDPKLGERELGHVLANAAPKARVGADSLGDAIVVDLGGGLTSGARRGASFAPVPLRGAPALVLYTSGTTGPPKGAVITDRNIAANLDMLARAWAWTDRDTVAHALPLFHVHGLVLGLFGSLRRGGALRWVPRFVVDDLVAALRDAAAHGDTMLFAVPTMYHRLCDAAEGNPAIADTLRVTRVLVSGSAPLPAREHERITRLTGQRVIERYGLTETLINCSTRHDGDRRAGCVGPPLDGVELRLVDDARNPLAVAGATGDDAMGEIAVRGPHVFAGYLDRDDATRAVLDGDGWFYTGDMATQSADGQIRIVGRRSSDIIKCGGFKVGAGEVEAALLEHAAVAEAAVIGVDDPDLGERIVAFVVAREATPPPAFASEIESHVAKLLSPHKRPREVHLVEALPRNAMGKVQKSVLRERRR